MILDFGYGIFYQLHTLKDFQNVTIETRYYAHKFFRNLLVTELYINASRLTHSIDLILKVNTSDTPDFNWKSFPKLNRSVYQGTTLTPEVVVIFIRTLNIFSSFF